MMIEQQRIQDEQAATLLTQANLHRLRKQWDEATTCCMQVLYHEPDNWSAHALLGDIYSDQGRPDEAIQWYCMTLDIRPESQSVREKLSKLVTTRRKQIVRSLDPSRPFIDRRGHSYPNTWMGKTAWHWSAPERRKQMTTGILIAAGLLGLVVLPVLVNSNASGARSTVFGAGQATVAPAFDLTQTAKPSTPVVSKPTDLPARSSVAPAPVRLDPTPALSSSQAPYAPPAPVSTAQPSVSVRDGSDAALTQVLQNDSGLRGMGITVSDAQYDPSSLILTVTFVAAGPMQPTVGDAILSDSEAVARAALGRPEASSATSCTVRCLTQNLGGQPADPNAPATLTFTGTMTRDVAARMPQQGQEAGSFSRTWWLPSIAAPASGTN